MTNPLGRLDDLPRAHVGHLPTPLEEMPNLSAELGVRVLVKRDDCSGLAFGGNKVRQLEYYFGKALAEGADVMLITGAVQSNYVRTTAAMARKLGMDCHVQLEDRVPGKDELYHSSGNVLLDKLFGATVHFYPDGEDEAGADANVHAIADSLRADGRKPFIVPLSPDNPPTGALGYVDCARELLGQLEERGIAVDAAFVPSGSSYTHAGFLFGLRALGSDIVVNGVCVRRDAEQQVPRVAGRLEGIANLLGVDPGIPEADVLAGDEMLHPGYGQLNAPTREAIMLAARKEGLLVDPVYSGKALAGLVAAARSGRLKDKRVLFLHTGGQPAIFAYGESLLG